MSKTMIFVSCVLLATLSFAELTVIYDNGNTTSITEYLKDRIQKESRPPRPKRKQQPFSFPIKSEVLTVGDVKPQDKRLVYLKQPVFLIGSDQRSEQWLMRNKENLLSMNAVGMLVEAESMSDVERIANIAEGLRLIPASADSIANKLGLKHYPVLISTQGWEQ